MRRRTLFILVTLVAACGDDDDGGAFDARPGVDAGADAITARLEDFLPPVPAPDGTARAVFAGAITAGNSAELIPGSARSGLVGDYFMRNAKARFVIQAPGRSIGIVPYGGNVVDAVALGGDGKDLTGDQFGELGLVYLLGRTCAHTRVEVLRDGAGGGAAVLRAIGKTAVNDYVNIKGLGLLPIAYEIDPDVGDSMDCATTYTLEPGATSLKVAWTLYNPGPSQVRGPIGTLNDTGGEVQVFAPTLGFTHLGGGGFESIFGGPTPIPYQIYQAPGVAYGIVPRPATASDQSAGLVISGAAVLIFGANAFADVLQRAKDKLLLDPGGGTTVRAELVVARDGAGVEEVYRRGRGDAVTPISGQVRFMPSDTPARARVVFIKDVNGNGTIDANDFDTSYFETDADGKFAGALPPDANYLVVADVPDVARSAVARVNLGTSALTVPTLTLADPARIDYQVVDGADETHLLPSKLTVVGKNAATARDARYNQTTERRFGLMKTVFAVHGTTTGTGSSPGDPPILVPSGSSYRVYVSRGPEWSIASFELTPAAGARVALPVARLWRVLDTSGYVATAFHEHSQGSPDSPVSFEDRLASLAAEGIELFAGTDHDRLTDYDPYIDDAGLRGEIDSVVGVETTPFAYGHFNAYPLELDPDDPSGGAIDWARGQSGFAMLPGEIFDAMRDRGAEVVQVCHPRSETLGGFQGYFGRAGLVIDFDARTAVGVETAQQQPAAVLRLPDTDLFSDDFNALEVFNSMGQGDTDGDGVREFTDLDQVLRDYFGFLSLGMVVTPVGNGDTHNRESSAAGLPRSLVRVPDDGRDALLDGLDADVWATMTGATRDVVVGNGPMIAVAGPAGSAIGKTVAPNGSGEVTFTITASIAGWNDLDTVELFANVALPHVSSGAASLKPFRCYSTRTITMAADPCFGASPLTVSTVEVAGGQTRREAKVTVTLRAEDIPRRAGATGNDAWLVVRARGSRGMFPVLPDDAVNDANFDAIMAGNLTSSLNGRGIPPSAFSAPVFIDFDGGGWRAPFAP